MIKRAKNDRPSTFRWSFEILNFRSHGGNLLQEEA
jgi:hypothetical protein